MVNVQTTAVLSPTVSASVDPKMSPIVDPPPTEFPYPESKASSERADRNRTDSDATLTSSNEFATDCHNEFNVTAVDRTREKSFNDKDALPTRPTLSEQKFETELARPVGVRPNAGIVARQSDGGRPVGGPITPQFGEGDNYSSSDSSSEEEDHKTSGIRRAGSHGDLSKARLNKVKRGPRPDKVTIGNEHFKSKGRVAKDGRLNISVNETAKSGYLAKALGGTIRSHLHPKAQQEAINAAEIKKEFRRSKAVTVIPRMNIVIMVIGSRGDIQPFIKIGKILKDKYHHRVRVATHPTFRKFVQEEMGLEFFSVGGDPSELMSFMVKNPGLIPSFETLKAGEVGRRREQMFEMFQGFWRACINTTDDEKDVANLKMLGNRFPFVADAIIANPPSFAHFHCAEKLGIPLHLVFTFPYSPTSAFPHPLANIKTSNVDREYTNYMSYPLVDLMTWQGLGDLVNRFRVKTLGLEPVSTLWAPGQVSRLRVPMTYLWSPGLVSKPADWGPEIDIAGYVFLDLGSSYTPPDDLKNFLMRNDSDKRPFVYIGFGSISGIDDPRAFCQMIFDAVVKANVKAIVSRGWGGMGDGMDIPDDVFMIDNVPHDWLFPQVDAVVHHGGAGTTAAGLKFGKPTMIVPFFGDQPFWASELAKVGAGAKQALPLKKLDSDKFAQGIRECLEEEAKQKAQKIAKSIEEEGDGAENCVDSFHSSLPLSGKHSMRCGIFDDRVAAWKIRNTGMHLSALAAELLVYNKQIQWSDLSLLRHKTWTDFQGPGEPITGVGGVVVGAFQEAVHGLTSISDMTKKDMAKIEKHKRKGRTVSDVVVLPGRVASRVRAESAASTQPPSAPTVPLNLHGEAEPPRLPVFHEEDDHVDEDANEDEDEDEYEAIQPAISRTQTRDTTFTEGMPAPIVVARDIGKGIGHSTKAVITLPLEMLNAVTLGFRNAPRLYGDRTVRPPPEAIHGFRSGFITAGKELWFGFYDGAVGIVKIPQVDLQQDGISGLPKGVARGFGGLLLKPVAGLLGVPTYTTKGVVAMMRRLVRDTEKTNRWLRRARMQQGAKEILELKRSKAQHEQSPNTPTAARRDGRLEEARTTALSRWTTHERQLLQQSREQERSLLPKVTRDRSSTI